MLNNTSGKTLLPVVLSILILSGMANGQSIFGTITGTVADASGAVIPKANVTMTNEGSGDVRKTVTNSDGYFTISSVPAGTYKVLIDAPGFQRWETTGIAFNGSDKRNLDVTMQVGTAAQAVEVISAQDLVTPVDSGEKSTVLNTAQLQNFTVVGRSAAEFIKILPGFSIAGTGTENRANFTGGRHSAVFGEHSQINAGEGDADRPFWPWATQGLARDHMSLGHAIAVDHGHAEQVRHAALGRRCARIAHHANAAQYPAVVKQSRENDDSGNT